MGHYDDCYASEEFNKMSEHDKINYYDDFRKDIENKGFVWGTLDDVRGYILLEWANYFNYKVKYNYNSFTVEERG